MLRARGMLVGLCLLLGSGAPPVQVPLPPAPVCDVELPLEQRLQTSWSTDRDLADLREEGVLRVGLAADPTSWFLDSKRFRGLEYELLRGFARSERLKLRIVPLGGRHERLRALMRGEVDLVAGRLERPEHSELVGVPLLSTRWVLVRARDAQSAPTGGPHDLERVLLVDGSVDPERLDLPADVRVETLPDGTLLEEALELVRAGRGALVAREALVRRSLGTDLVVGAELGAASPAILHRSGSGELGGRLARWMERQSDGLARLQARYLGPRGRARRVISDFDGHFQQEAGRIGWSWPLLAAVAWQESRFRPQARSPVGASGLMQIMPDTADLLGLADPTEPRAAIRAGARYLAQLDRRWQARIPDPVQRLGFVLASYNAGPGHVDDAVALAQAAGADATRWEEVAPWMLALADRTWNRRPEVRHGYCRGEEPVAYVEAILARWQAYEATLSAGTSTPSLW